MPMPRRSSVEDFFDKLGDHQRPYLEQLRRLSIEADPAAEEKLAWNLPVYVRDGKARLWMLQNFKSYCSLRFPPRFFGPHRSEVEAAGYEAGRIHQAPLRPRDPRRALQVADAGPDRRLRSHRRGLARAVHGGSPHP